ncbi:carbohydrate sulfotransferase 10-like isoform X2 [Branchiostoma floridae x Branchiostoma belcheri]
MKWLTFTRILLVALLLLAILCLNLEKDIFKATLYIRNRTRTYGLLDQKRTAERIQSERIATLKSYCRTNDTKITEFPTRRRFIVNERYKLLYCQVFKTGSTTTLTILHNLEHNDRRNTHDMREQLNDLPFKRLNTYSDEEVRFRFETYTKLIIVRNPLERLVSAWEDKFSYAPSRFGYRKQYHSMLKTLLSNTSNTKLGPFKLLPEGTDNRSYPIVPFPAFIKAVGTNRTEWQDPHWQLISDLCAPCQIDYDFIMHTETIAEDYQLFFRKAGIVGREDLIPEVRQRKGDKLFWNFYKEIPMEDLWQIKQKFKVDYDMFGYNFHDDIARLFSR